MICRWSYTQPLRLNLLSGTGPAFMLRCRENSSRKNCSDRSSSAGSRTNGTSVQLRLWNRIWSRNGGRLWKKLIAYWISSRLRSITEYMQPSCALLWLQPSKDGVARRNLDSSTYSTELSAWELERMPQELTTASMTRQNRISLRESTKLIGQLNEIAGFQGRQGWRTVCAASRPRSISTMETSSQIVYGQASRANICHWLAVRHLQARIPTLRHL